LVGRQQPNDEANQLARREDNGTLVLMGADFSELFEIKGVTTQAKRCGPEVKSDRVAA
jgi:hypothetical protein